MERIENLKGKVIKVKITEGKEADEYALTIDFDGHCSMSSSGYKEGGDFTMYSMTPEALVNLAMGIIEVTAHAKASRDLQATLAIKEKVVIPAPEDLLRTEQEAKL